MSTNGVLPAQTELKPVSSADIRKSVAPDRLTCLVCGETFTSLKRHISAKHGMSPESYRKAFGLLADYPMVAPDYSERRSGMAKEIGLGLKKGGRKKRAA